MATVIGTTAKRGRLPALDWQLFERPLLFSITGTTALVAIMILGYAILKYKDTRRAGQLESASPSTLNSSPNQNASTKLVISHVVTFFLGGILVIIVLHSEMEELQYAKQAFDEAAAEKLVHEIREKAAILRAIREQESEFAQSVIAINKRYLQSTLEVLQTMLESDQWVLQPDGTEVLHADGSTHQRTQLEEVSRLARVELEYW